MKIIQGQQDPSRIQALLELLKVNNLDAVSVLQEKVQKELTKNETWRASVASVFGLEVNHDYLPSDFETDDEKIVKTMDAQFLKKSQSIKLGKRSDQIVTALKNDYSERTTVEGGKKRKFLGLI